MKLEELEALIEAQKNINSMLEKKESFLEEQKKISEQAFLLKESLLNLRKKYTNQNIVGSACLMAFVEDGIENEANSIEMMDTLLTAIRIVESNLEKEEDEK